ncbi:hypothetical protein [Nostoc sp.]|uniref:hypothetical protein n=1 Tax=Nostoc sp. TaxID=1180 RepID=UPI002FFB86AA
MLAFPLYETLNANACIFQGRSPTVGGYAIAPGVDFLSTRRALRQVWGFYFVDSM